MTCASKQTNGKTHIALIVSALTIISTLLLGGMGYGRLVERVEANRAEIILLRQQVLELQSRRP